MGYLDRHACTDGAVVYLVGVAVGSTDGLTVGVAEGLKVGRVVGSLVGALLYERGGDIGGRGGGMDGGRLVCEAGGCCGSGVSIERVDKSASKGCVDKVGC